MTTSPRDDPNLLDPRSGAFGYVALCGAALAVLLLVLLQRGQNLVVSLLILSVGVAGVLTRMRLAPLLVLGLVTFNELFQQFTVSQAHEPELGRVFQVSDVLLCAALLGFVAGQYRLQGLGRFVFPPDEHVGQIRTPITVVQRRRSALLVTPQEVSLLAVSLPFWALAAQLAWHWLAQQRALLEWDGRIVRATVCLFALVTGLTVAAAVLHHVRRRRMTLEEATLLLQDTFWNETRGEQRWLARWLAWFWLRHKEQP